jgi:tetratricopeptide (TPR) repeat protein
MGREPVVWQEPRMVPLDPHDELRQARLRRGWLRPELVDRLQRWEDEHGSGKPLPVDRNYVYRWETGKRGVSEFYAIRLEAVLGIPRERLIDRRARRRASSPEAAARGGGDLGRRARAVVELPSQPYAPEVVTAIRRTLLGYGPAGRLAAAGDDAVRVVAALDRQVKRAWQLRQKAQYVALGDLLPGLLADAELATRELPEPQRGHAVRLLVHAYNATSAMLKRLGDAELASIASDRAIQAAQGLGDPLLVASAYYRLANVFLPAGRLAEAKEIARSAADLLEPGLASSRAQLAAWGGLLLTAALASARQGEWAETWELFGEAKTASRRLGHDYADLHTIFGPTNLAIHGVQLSVELGDGREALRRAEQVDPDRLPPSLLERRSHFLIDVARVTGSASRMPQRSLPC